ncbi:MAG: aminopeptidase P family protein [Candidatus Aminicenantes bacterium]|nr:aminopeptidase P family protein [Candidatus Aminicenantes bacterium]
MFDKTVYIERRKLLKKQVKSGVILILGNVESPMNYPANTYPFRQDSNFLYFFGQDKPGFVGVIDVEEDKDYLYGEDFTIDDVIWMGPQPSVKELAAEVGVSYTGSPAQLAEKLKDALSKKRKAHFTPPYRAENAIQLEKLLDIPINSIKENASVDLIKAIVEQRSLKSAAEVREIEKALEISYEMYALVMGMTKPGIYEREIVGKIEGAVGSYGAYVSFPIILSIHGETLHNHHHANLLKQNNLLVTDSGAESPLHYASDITRTFPVGGRFTPEQKDIYQVVLNSQLAAIDSVKPGKPHKEVHLLTAAVIAQGLKDIGLMKGDIAAAIEEGAHALFFPHGLGHMLGLDVHDMEDLGENYVGYDETVERSKQFGLAYLRLAKALKPGYVVTSEPGIYFIPALIDQWKAEKKFEQFIDYAKVEKFKDFGGIRIEDDVLVTDNGHRVLGKPIPKTVDEIEKIMAK